MGEHEVVVIGAGLAGLRCALRLAERGREVVVLDAGDAVGGRQRTDAVDGFLLDRGFQVLNPAYPAVRCWIDVPALDLQRFPVGVRVRRAARAVTIAHPLRHPTLIAATVRSGLVGPREVAALARWALPALANPRAAIAGDDRALLDGWDRAGLRGPLRREVLEPFLAGVLADDTGATSDVFAQLLVRMFALGTPGVPARGIGALPAQLAATARTHGADIRLGHRVSGIHRRGGAIEVAVDGGDTLRARDVVVAVGPDAVTGLVDVPAPRTRGLQTWWFAADEAPTSRMLAVDGRRAGPIVNTVVISRTAASYAPTGRHLIAATCLLPEAAVAAPREADVRAHLTDIWEDAGASSDRTWQLLRRDDIRHALPAQTPPLRTTSPVRVAEGVFLAGDHRTTASLQGALVSGERAAGAVLSAQPPSARPAREA